MKHNLPSEFLLHITNRKTDQTFSVPLQYEELATELEQFLMVSQVLMRSISTSLIQTSFLMNYRI